MPVRRSVIRHLWIAALLTLSCSSASGPLKAPGAQGEYVRGKDAYDQGQHLKAIEILEAFERRHPGSQYIDDALYYLGKAHQAGHEYLLARQSFERILISFPRSNYAEEAWFEIARSWYLSIRGPALDPEPAEEAAKSFADYLGRYAEGTHVEEAREALRSVHNTLAEKAFLNGRTYLRLGRTEAARRCFRKSHEQWPHATSAAKALYGLAKSYVEDESRDEAREVLQRLIELLEPDPERYDDGSSILERARKDLNALGR